MSSDLTRTMRYFLRYCVVGIIGTGVDVGILYVLVNYRLAPFGIALVLAFMAAVTSNFILNKKWTFDDTSTKRAAQYLVFLGISVVGLIVTFFLMWFFVTIHGVWYIFAKLITSCIVMVFNFSANTLITFRKKDSPNS